MRVFSLLFLTLFFVRLLSAQPISNSIPNYETKKVTLTSGVEGSLLQFATLKSGNLSYKTIPRYSYFFNIGVDINFNLHANFAPFTGFQLKNIGLITRINDSIRYKERVYTIGAPLGVKFFLADKKFMLKVGADVALAFNYKKKYFLNDDKLYKYNEFFSNDAAYLFASVFAGVSYKGISLTGNYYLTNFYNPSFTKAVAKMTTISLGIHLDENTLKLKKKDTDTKTASIH